MSGSSTRQSMSRGDRLMEASAAAAGGERSSAILADVRPVDAGALDDLVRLRPRLVGRHVEQTTEDLGQPGGERLEQLRARLRPTAGRTGGSKAERVGRALFADAEV